MSLFMQEEFTRIIHERRAVKRFDQAHTVDPQSIKELLNAANRAPSAWNLQHWKYVVVNEPEAKAKLHPIAYGQNQVVDASFTVIVLGDLEANRNAEAVFEADVMEGRMPEQVKNNLIKQINEAYTGNPVHSRDEAIRNASLAAMQLMLAAKAAGLDSCPMGGYNASMLIEAFRIPPRYIPVMLIAVGKMAEPARPSNRFQADETIVWNGF